LQTLWLLLPLQKMISSLIITVLIDKLFLIKVQSYKK